MNSATLGMLESTVKQCSGPQDHPKGSPGRHGERSGNVGNNINYETITELNDTYNHKYRIQSVNVQLSKTTEQTNYNK